MKDLLKKDIDICIKELNIPLYNEKIEVFIYGKRYLKNIEDVKHIDDLQVYAVSHNRNIIYFHENDNSTFHNSISYIDIDNIIQTSKIIKKRVKKSFLQVATYFEKLLYTDAYIDLQDKLGFIDGIKHYSNGNLNFSIPFDMLFVIYYRLIKNKKNGRNKLDNAKNYQTSLLYTIDMFKDVDNIDDIIVNVIELYTIAIRISNKIKKHGLISDSIPVYKRILEKYIGKYNNIQCIFFINYYDKSLVDTLLLIIFDKNIKNIVMYPKYIRHKIAYKN